MKERINIFVDCHVFDGNFQGSTTYLNGLYTEMVKDRAKHFFLAASKTEILEDIFGIADNITYVEYRSHNKFFRLLFDIPRIIKANKIDFAHFQYVAPPIKYCKYIVTIHDILFMDFPEYFPLSYRLKNRFLFGFSARKADIVLTVSEFSKKQIQRHFGVPDVAITPNAVNPVYFENYDKPSVKKQVKAEFRLDDYWIYISRREPRKNHLSLLKVFAEKGYHKHYQLVFVGDEAIENLPYDAYFSSLPDSIRSRVFSFNKVNSERLLKLLRGATLSLYPSFAEGFGIPPLEAAAANVPSLFSGTTAMADFDFMTNMMFDPAQTESIAHKIEYALREWPGKDYSGLIKAHYSWESSANILEGCIERLA